MHSPRRFPRWGLLWAAYLAGCQPDLSPLPVAPEGQGYQLGVGDEIRLTTFGEKDLSGDFTIDDSGNLALPLTGPISAQGMTTKMLSDAIARTLKEKNLLADPSVAVEVVKYRPVFVLGEVTHPGPYPYVWRMTMLNAVALAGGFTPRAAKSFADVVRKTPTMTVQGRVGPLGEVQPGDIVTVEERNF